MKLLLALVASVALCPAFCPAARAADPTGFVGTWTWDKTKSVPDPNDPEPPLRSETVTFTQADSRRYAGTIDIVTATGETVHRAFDAKVGGPASPVTGADDHAMITVTRADASTHAAEIAADGGKEVTECRLATPKVMTCASTYTEADGKTFKMTDVYERKE